MTWHVAEDSDGDETLWYGDEAVLRRFELGAKWWHGTDAEGCRDTLWSVLSRVLAPDEATVERLARALFAARSDAIGLRITWAHMNGPHRKRYLDEISAVLAALAAAPDPDGRQREGVSG